MRTFLIKASWDVFRHRLLIALVFVTPLVGCVSRQLPPGTTSHALTIGVISKLGSQVYFARSGVTTFGNGKSTNPVPDWRIDDLVIQEVTKALGPAHRIVSHVGPPETVETEKPGPEAADLWLEVVPVCANGSGYIGPVPCGVSVNRVEKVFTSGEAWFEIEARISIIDGHTMKLLASNGLVVFTPGQCPPLSDTGGFLAMTSNGNCTPAVKLGPDFVVDQWSDYSPSQIEYLHQQFLKILRPSIEATLQQLNFSTR